MGDGSSDRERNETSTRRHPDTCGQPNGGCRREATNAGASDEDDAGSDEPDPRNDLCGDPGWISGSRGDIVEAELADEHEDGRAHADEGVCPQSSALLSKFALEPDDRRESERHSQQRQLVRPAHRSKIARTQRVRVLEAGAGTTSTKHPRVL